VERNLAACLSAAAQNTPACVDGLCLSRSNAYSIRALIGSHACFPIAENGKKFAHEDYSVAIIRTELKGAIEEHELNGNYRFRVEDIAALVEGSAGAKQSVFWRDLISGQMDADRMDYLLRDSYHAGVQYGKFDLHRLIARSVFHVYAGLFS